MADCGRAHNACKQAEAERRVGIQLAVEGNFALGTVLQAAQRGVGLKWVIAISTADGMEKSKQHNILLPPPSSSKIFPNGRGWVWLGSNGKHPYYAYADGKGEVVDGGFKRLKRGQNESTVEHIQRVRNLLNKPAMERNRLEAPSTPFNVQCRLLATGKYSFRVTFDREGQVNKKLILSTFDARPPKPPRQDDRFWLRTQVACRQEWQTLWLGSTKKCRG